MKSIFQIGFYLILSLPIISYSNGVEKTNYLQVDKEGKITCAFQQIELRQIIDELEEKYNLTIEGFDTLQNRTVSFSTKNSSLESSLKRILNRTNYSLLFDDKEKPIKIVILNEKAHIASRYNDTNKESKLFMSTEKLPTTTTDKNDDITNFEPVPHSQPQLVNSDTNTDLNPLPNPTSGKGNNELPQNQPTTPGFDMNKWNELGLGASPPLPIGDNTSLPE